MGVDPVDSTAFLIHRGGLGASERNLIKIVEFSGGSVCPVDLAGETVLPTDLQEALGEADKCLMISARTLAGLGGDLGRTIWRQLGAADAAAKILVYDFEPTPEDAQLLREITAGALVAIEPSPAAARKIEVGQDSICRQLAGLSFEVPATEIQCAFVQGTARDAIAPLMSIGEKHFFARLQEGGSVFLLARGQIADLDAVVPQGASVLRFFAGLVPALMFLHAALHPRLWHNDSPAACFIIDDPLLKRRYGYLDYEKLLELMDQKHFSTSIAFIPWNYKRSQKGVAQLLRSRPDAYSLSVHGCDHTRGEFGSVDPIVLRHKARLALERMNWHRRLAGVDFDDVMVFPQGIFSTAAMTALKSCGYLAAVNSTAFPIGTGHDLALRDLLQVAVTKFSGFPLFTRCYPRHLPEVAFALFLGKPALLVEHHSFFRKGYDALAETIESLHRMEPRLQWTNLATICSRACLKRVAESGEVHVQFFTDRFQLRNEASQPQQYVLFRQRLLGPMTEVTLNGRLVDVRRNGNGVSVQLKLAAGEVAEIRIVDVDRQPEVGTASPKPRLRYQAGVFVRRRLSELRDNWSMHPFGDRAVRSRKG